MPVNKKEISMAIAQGIGCSGQQSAQIVDRITGAIVEALARGEEVQVSGFGKFAVRQVPERRGRNPRTGEEIDIAAHKAVKFQPSKTLKDILNA